MACRNEQRGNEAVEEVKKFSNNQNVIFLQLDLGSLDSVRECSKKFHQLENHLDILINNAGVMSPEGKTIDGFEEVMGINHLGTFLFTNLLLDLLKASSEGRIVVVASGLHTRGVITKEDFASGETKFPGVLKAYANSKLANILFTRELAKRVDGVTVNSCCPGPVNTNVLHSLNFFLRSVAKVMMKLFYRTPEHGAETQVMLAIDPIVKGVTGKFYVNCEEREPSKEAQDDETACWLWEESVKLTKLQ
jgi:NAD(P)-dependent dehydrogenase (short-subunit alcohol dehydrogenase family)